ncbi:hypothetical protein HDU76_007009, partial [Blyttiomyces sp. JEL0837]
MVKLIWSFAYDLDKFSIDYAQVPADAIFMAVKMNRLEMVQFFMKSTRLRLKDSFGSTKDSDNNDTDDYYEEDVTSVEAALNMVIYALSQDGVNKTNIKFLELYFALGGELESATNLISDVKVDVEDVKHVLDVFVLAGFRKGMAVRDISTGWWDGLLEQRDFQRLQYLWEYWYFDLVDFGKQILSIGLKEVSNMNRKTSTDCASTFWTMETVISRADEFIFKSNTTISEYCIAKCLDWLLRNKIVGFDLIEIKGLVQLMMRGDFKFYAVWLNNIDEIPHVKEILRIHVHAGFHIGVADDDFVITLHTMLVNNQVDIVDYLWNMGALDSFEFGRRVISLSENTETVSAKHARRKLINDLCPSGTGSEKVDWIWTMETVILSAAGVNINKIAGLKALVVSTNQRLDVISSWLIEHAKVVPSNDHLPLIITNCYKSGQVQILQKLIDLGLLTTTMLGTRLLKAFEDGTFSSLQFTSVVTWLIESDYWDSIDMQDFSTQFLKELLKGRFLTLLERM